MSIIVLSVVLLTPTLGDHGGGHGVGVGNGGGQGGPLCHNFNFKPSVGPYVSQLFVKLRRFFH